LLQTAKRIASNISVPFSVDMEGGFSRNTNQIIENIEKLHDIGAVGINIEDSLKGETFIQQPAHIFEHIISSIANHLAKRNMQMFINARTDAFVVRLPNALNETIARIKLYENAGATGVFVPFLVHKEDISAVVQSTKLPVNVFATQGLPGFAELGALGVKRISLGSALYNALKRRLQQTIEMILQEQSFDYLYES
jgi:2-methylisocitrate lyase-like PEP mutase family enzyme